MQFINTVTVHHRSSWHIISYHDTSIRLWSCSGLSVFKPAAKQTRWGRKGIGLLFNSINRLQDAIYDQICVTGSPCYAQSVWPRKVLLENFWPQELTQMWINNDQVGVHHRRERKWGKYARLKPLSVEKFIVKIVGFFGHMSVHSCLCVYYVHRTVVSNSILSIKSKIALVLGVCETTLFVSYYYFFKNTVIPRLTKTVRSGITFVSRNVISCRFL